MQSLTRRQSQDYGIDISVPEYAMSSACSESAYYLGRRRFILVPLNPNILAIWSHALVALSICKSAKRPIFSFVRFHSQAELPLISSCPGWVITPQLKEAQPQQLTRSTVVSDCNLKKQTESEKTPNPIRKCICKVYVSMGHAGHLERRLRVGDTTRRPGLSTTWISSSSWGALQMPRCFCLGTRIYELWGPWKSTQNWLPSFVLHQCMLSLVPNRISLVIYGLTGDRIHRLRNDKSSMTRHFLMISTTATFR